MSLDKSKPASEQLDPSTETNDKLLDPEKLHEVAQELELVKDSDLSCHSSEFLAELVEACKRIENAAEDARKKGYEDELTPRVSEGETVGNLRKTGGSNRYVTDHAGAFDAVLDAGEDPRKVAKVSASKLADLLGEDADEWIGESSYSYFRRQP